MNVKTFLFKDDGSIPNNPNLPLLIYEGAFPSTEQFESTILEHGWTGTWVDGVYDYHHYHSTSHEVLGVVSGTAEILFGGENGTAVAVKIGDVAVIPAGVGHKCIGKSSDFQVMGAYPDDQEMDMCTGKKEERPQALNRIQNVPLPEHDPLLGKGGPLFDYWK
ncbi:cupin domain-containing protein [Metabacillus idriensis]|uniref:cupin domain-containing protein n=1 Tax=Metabacillus idriensis TaxID=324768 RepID=UPI003D284FDA